MAYLRRQYRVVAIAFAALFVLFLVMSMFNVQNKIVPFAFLTGGFFSGLCGYFGMRTATRVRSSASIKSRQKMIWVN